MPAVGDLKGVRQRLGGRLAIAAATIARHDRDLRMSAEPRFDGCPLAIGQERHDAPAFQIADDRPIAMITTEGPVVDADHAQGADAARPAAPHDSQQRVVADGQHQPLGEGRCRSAAERQA